jgi:hypothetical protein
MVAAAFFHAPPSRMSNHRCYYSKERCIYYCTPESKRLADNLLKCQEKNLESPTDANKEALYEAECAWRAFAMRVEACATKSHLNVVRNLKKD